MADANAIVASLHRAAAILAEGGEVVVAEALTMFATHGTPLHQSLGLAPDWHTVMRRRQRDAALAALAERRFSHLHGRKQARAISAALAEYVGRGLGRRSETDALLSGILALGEPPGAERIFQLLRNEPCNHA